MNERKVKIIVNDTVEQKEYVYEEMLTGDKMSVDMDKFITTPGKSIC